MKEVKIGDQIWMVENLTTDKFRNGDIIAEAKTNEEWKKANENKQPAWCYYGNDLTYGEKYGKLYNWYAVTDQRGLAPEGWHIPSDNEFKVLTDFLGGVDDACVKLKSTTGWKEDGNGSNESGFSAIPGGSRNCFGDFIFVDKEGKWWSSTEEDPGLTSSLSLYRRISGSLELDGYKPTVYRYFQEKGGGLSVRCVKGSEKNVDEKEKTFWNSKKVESTKSFEVKIGDQIWMVENLTTDKFRNGDIIQEVKTPEEWIQANANGTPAWCYYANNKEAGEIYGKLYNFHAINDKRGLAPDGWHIPTNEEWIILENNINALDAGKKLKSISGWKEDGNGTNEFGFSGLPGGCCSGWGTFSDIGYIGNWWSSSVENYREKLGHNNYSLKRFLTSKSELLEGHSKYLLSRWDEGLSVRCIKD